MNLNNLTIKNKLYGLALLVTLCLIILSTVMLRSFSSIKSLNETLLLIQSSKINMLSLRRNEKDFLARLDIKYHQKFKDNYAALMNNINKVKLNIKSTNIDQEQERRLTNLVTYLQGYQLSFNKLITLQQNIGFDHESGLQGKLRKSAHKAESLLIQSDSIQLTVKLLMMRRNEKDFMLRRLEQYLEQFNRNFTAFNRHLNESLLSDRIKAEITTSMSAYHSLFTEFGQRYIERGLTPNEGLQGKMRSTIHKTEAIFNNFIQTISNNITTQSDLLYKKLLLITGIILILIVGLVMTIAHSVSVRLGYLQVYLNKLAAKPDDLTVSLQINGNDEITDISHVFNQFIANFKAAFNQIPEFTGDLEKESSINTVIANETYQLAISQETESTEIADAVQQMTFSTEEITKNIQIAANSAEEASKFVSKGKQAIEDVSLSINSLATKLQSSVEVTKDLEENSNNISTVLDVIRGIAEQTNLLALNAAIEAARAGEQGRGFAVVADEVRTLASRTQDSTTQIQSLIESFQANVKSTVLVMQEGSTGASTTAENATHAMQVLDEISNTVNNIFELNTNIASASEEQSAISNNINASISRINEMARDTANQSNKTNQSSSEIKSIASKLQLLVGSYQF